MIGYFYVFIIVLGSCYNIHVIAQDTTVHIAANRPDFAATGYYYLFPEAANTATFTATSDYKNWHGELRYNYEDIHTVSFFGGRTFDFGRKLKVCLTPLIGIVSGRTNAIAPGLETQLEYSIFDFYAESEYLLDFKGMENSYYYVWSELGVSPFNFFRTGITIQRTKIYKTRFDLQHGFFVSYKFGNFRPSFYFFNPVSNHIFFVVALEYTL